MFFGKPKAPQDLDAFNPAPVRSRFINVETVPDNIAQMPQQLWPFLWFFFSQIRLALVAMTILFGAAFSIYTLMPLFAREVVLVFERHDGQNNIWQELLPLIGLFAFLLLFLQAALYFSGRYVWSSTGWPFRALVVGQLTAYVREHSLNFFQGDFAGRISGKINECAEGMRSLMADYVFRLLHIVVNIIMSFVLAWQIDGVFAGILSIYYAILVVILFVFVPSIVKKSMRTQDAKSSITGQVVDVISNIYTMKVFARQEHEQTRLNGHLNDYSRNGRRMSFEFGKIQLCLESNNLVMWVMMFGMLIWRIEHGQSNLADMALLAPIVINLANMAYFLSETIVAFFENIGTVKDGINTLVKPFTIVDAPDAGTLKIDGGAIRFADVGFAYPGRQVFEGLNIDISLGQKIGLVGPSGAGKSTLVQLLLRLHDIQSGAITIDGQDIRHVTQNSLRRHIAVIPQHSDLMHRSIRENILYGRLDASEDEIIAASKRAHAHEFILELQDHEGRRGYDALVGERGVKLSGGQRQRIAIARAVLKDAPILLLDEATSALDSESERLIQASLHDLMSGRTVIAIAHRLSTIAQLDRLLVMEQGRIIEDGNHYDLLDRNGLYARLWALQSGGFLPENIDSGHTVVA